MPSVNAIQVMGSDVYVGGSFTNAGGILASNIARWDGSSWSALDAGILDGSVDYMTVYNNELYVSGAFTKVGTTNANNIAKWDGSAWSPVGGGLIDSHSPLAAYGGALYAGGRFTNDGPIVFSKWDGNQWSIVDNGVLPAPPNRWPLATADFMPAEPLSSTGRMIIGWFDGTAPIGRWSGTDRISEIRGSLLWQSTETMSMSEEAFSPAAA
jgi:hypothetical protein